MIRFTNANEFARDLAEEFGPGLRQRIAEAENDIAREILADARAATPRATGELAGAWGIAVGDPDPILPGNNGEPLATRHPSQPVFVFCNDFRASFFEDGTVKMAPRPMLAPAIARADKVTRVL